MAHVSVAVFAIFLCAISLSDVVVPSPTPNELKKMYSGMSFLFYFYFTIITVFSFLWRFTLILCVRSLVRACVCAENSKLWGLRGMEYMCRLGI